VSETPTEIVLRYNRRPEEGFPEAVARIVAVCRAKGYRITPDDASLVWETYSDEHYAAGWMSMMDGERGDEEIMRAVLEYCVPADPAPPSARTEAET
jgi:hypothetical protein